jgi:hypothetical protein
MCPRSPEQSNQQGASSSISFRATNHSPIPQELKERTTIRDTGHNITLTHDFQHTGLDILVCDTLDVAIPYPLVENLQGFAPDTRMRGEQYAIINLYQKECEHTQ